MSNNLLNLIVQFTGVDKLSGGLKNIIGLGRSGGQVLGGMQREARGLERELRDVRRQLESATGDVTALANQERELERRVQGANEAIRRQRDELARQGRNAKMDARGQELQAAGQQQMISGATLLTPIVIAGKAAMDFSSGMVDIQQKANLTNRETRAMADNILRAAEAAHRMPEDMRAGVDTLAGLGLDPRQAVQMIGPIGQLGTAFKVDMADGAAAAFANLNNLKVGLGDTARALDIMAASGNAGAFEVKDMAKHFPGLTAQMQALGQHGVGAVADLSAALQIARQGAGDADEAGNNVKNLLAKINSPATIKAFQKNFGVDLPAAMKAAYAKGRTPMEALAEITQKATGGDLSKIGFVVEDMQAQSALRMLILKMDEYRAMRAQIANSSGTISQAFNQRELQDGNVAWASFLSTASRLAITLGTTLLPVATRFLGMVNSILSRVSAWAQANPQLAGTLMSLAAGFAVIKIGLGLTMFLFGGTLSAVAKLLPYLGMARTAVLLLGRGVMQAGLMMMANPMVALIVGIGLALAGLAYLVYANWDRIKAAFSAGWSAVKSVLAAAPGWLRSLGGQMMQGLLSLIDPFGLRNRLLAVARNGIAAFKSFFGIKSPSRLMMQMGGHMTEGLGIGLDRGGQRPLQAMGRLSAGLAGAGPTAGGMAGGGAPGATQGGAGKWEIHIHQRDGEDAQALAERVARIIDRRDGQRGLATYTDQF
ncbi:phage tail tape measure protein [Croceicoccus sp. BE223]|uniref:phage tail tape measure protein n=1 Tax=Croceicoccus sp. BE223 TaxID=2817716 RepID=UPI002861E4E2|nr:phage tail tape measure protein [Croceicoccus sp. BE223]MDR7101450.1 TP901 family phage tail tape measure protein [Croceicoccus sp. BE223]